jgi:hypothetical protein
LIKSRILKQLKSPFVAVAIGVGAFSLFLAYQGKDQAAITGAGVVVAAVVAKRNEDATTVKKDDDIASDRKEPSLAEVQARYLLEEIRNDRKTQEKIIQLTDQLMQREDQLIKCKDQLQILFASTMDLRNELIQMKQDRIEQDFKPQVIIEEKRLESQKLEEQYETKSLPESSLNIFKAEVQEMQVKQRSGEYED